jgi:hypothetical protein
MLATGVQGEGRHAAVQQQQEQLRLQLPQFQCVKPLACCAVQLDKERRQQLMQLALDERDEAMLSLLLQQPGISAAALSLHRAMAWLPRGLVRQLVTAGAPINQTDPEDGSRLTHKVRYLSLLRLCGAVVGRQEQTEAYAPACCKAGAYKRRESKSMPVGAA